ncbi:hypothetical protein Pst134EA_032991 [Puccinia striiformis f. sp. tritici]|uniref:uncharacterized protein n=1 Tax=Puccinia striiformis f. sp. tritici TaxID=168172 RepID=UPI0020086446|nr:uncharacterized protein Pst134EA_032991 [Puccinia striiformis f. sp. tritici]KAH9440836.1 hypothetical protein Pst134EA_032991 [Puccinia striiformis f. sp. tritici]
MLNHPNSNSLRRQADQHTLSHLLGFTLPPRSAQSSQSPSSARRPARRHHAHNTYYDKDQFVHAKYRFILKPTGDSTVYFADPDIRFNWPDILQVIVNLSTSLPTISAHPQTADSDSHASSEKHACPICLSEPTAGRMTKCGHIFCYPCILHYLELSDDGKAQGRNTEAVRDTTGSLSDLMSFRLIERPNFTTLALPRSSTWLSSAVPTHHSPWQFTPDALTFAKFMIAAPDYMMAELNSNLEELHNELLLLSKWSASQDESRIWVWSLFGLQRLKLNRDQDLSAQLQLCTTTDEDELTPTPATVESMISDDQPAYLPNQVEHTLPSSPAATNSHQVDELEVSSEPRLLKSDFLSPPVPKTRKNVNPPEPTSTTYRFYQAASGELIYLSALDIRVLLAKFGSFDSFPSSITLKVEGWSEVGVSDDLRRRCRYLSHLPTGSEVRMVEVDLDEYLGDDCSLVEAVRKRRAKRKEDEEGRQGEDQDWNSFATNSVPDWVAPLDPKDDPIRQDHPSLGAVPGSNDLTRGSVRLIESDVQPSGSRTVWGTYLRPNATSSSSPADEEHDQDDNDVWAKHEHRLGINRNRAGGQGAELNTEDLDDSDDDNQEAGAEGGRKSWRCCRWA